MYLLKLSTRPWRRSPFSQVFTSAAVGILLFLAAFLFWMQRGLGPAIDRLANEQVITAYLDPSLNPSAESDAVKTIDDTIRTSVGSHAEIELVGSDKFLNHLREEYPGLVSEIEDLGAEMQAVVPRYVSISGVFPAGTLNEVKSVKGVQSAESSVDRFRNVVGAFRALRWIATLLICGLGLALTTALIHLGRTNAHLHQDSSSLMELMGASPAALVSPGLISGALVGLLGGLCAAIGWRSLGIWMARYIRELSPVLTFIPSMSSHSENGFAVGLIILGFSLGAFSGLLGNWLGRTNPRHLIRGN